MIIYQIHNSNTQNIKIILKQIFFVIILFASIPANSQLSDFELEVIKTDETCLGNASLTFNTSNITQGATLLYTVYQNPDLIVPISVSGINFLNNLNAGTYTVVVLQTLGNLSNAQSVEVVIENIISPLTYTINAITLNCEGEGGQIEVNTITGIAVEYEIISGPETRPLQDSNIFSGLQGGTYNIRVFDICGQGVVLTYTLVLTDTTPQVSQPLFASVLEGNCDSVIITNTITYPEGSGITYPLNVVYTINLPDGTTEVITESYEEGNSFLFELSHEFDLFEGENYTYDIEVTNGCGVIYGSNGMNVNPQPALNNSVVPLPCGDSYITLFASQFNPPYTLEFLNMPEGFNPLDFNAGYPGPFNDAASTYGGDENAVPEGVYEVQLTDACGNTAVTIFEVIEELPPVSANGRNNGCYAEFGRITISVQDRDIVSGMIITAPDDYDVVLPHDVSAFINADGRLMLTNMPVGIYTIIIIDECGTEHEVEVEVPEFVESDFAATATADCFTGLGALEINSGNGKLVTLTMIAAPSGFDEPLPFNVTPFINTSGRCYMNSLPEGEYTFEGIDICGIERTVTITIAGYQPSVNPFTFVPNCNSFNIVMSDTDGVSSSPTYWLQEYNSVSGQWGHPQTGVAYTEGNFPNNNNSYSLPGNDTVYNLTFTGDFRIIKAFESVGNGNAENNCLEILGEFSYSDGVTIQNIYNLSCLGNPDDVYVQATGHDPLIYRITEKDGQPFLIENGTDNIFSGLSPGEYKFEVEDACGHIGNRVENINTLPPLAQAGQPNAIHLCALPEDLLTAEFELVYQNETILNGQSPESYTITYHLTLEDAENALNPLPDVYTNVSSPQTIYARLVHNLITICYDIVSFEIKVSDYPVLPAGQQVYLCLEEGYTTLFAGSGFDTYLWSTGEATQSINVYEAGTYSVTVGNIFGEITCDATEDITVIASEMAEIMNIKTTDWTESSNTIAVSVSGVGDYEFSLDGVNYQDEPFFYGLESGLYTIYIQDKNGCGITQQEVALLYYPNFFTPNGDTYNDTWRIKYSVLEPNMKVSVFDRYGKLITSFGSMSEGWDGTYNGQLVPSTDYWFVVEREDGRIHKGHFAMLR